MPNWFCSFNTCLGLGHGKVLDDLLELIVGKLAPGVHLLALLLTNATAHLGSEVELDSALAHVDDAIGAEDLAEGGLELIQSIAGHHGAGIGNAHELLGAVVLVVDGGLEKSLVDVLDGLLEVVDAAAPPAAVAAAATEGEATAAVTATAAESAADDGALHDGGLEGQEAESEERLALNVSDADDQNGQKKKGALHDF